MNKATQPTEILTGLLTATGRGDRGAFTRLYRLASAKLFGLLLRILKDEAAAEDCLQEVFLAVWRHAGRYDPGQAAPMTWLTVIARHRALDRLRRVQPVLSLDSVDEALLGSHPDPVEAGAGGMTTQLNRCLDELVAAQRECLLLAYTEGLTQPELATRLAIPLGTVKTWVRRGLEQLRNCLES